MGASFINVDRNSPLLLPPDMRDWVGDEDMVHFVLEAVEPLPLSAFKINRRGSGDPQYPPRTLLALLIYCYANGIFGSRRIERATYRDLAVRYLTADTHPDHSTICQFRKDNFQAISEAFLRVLLLAKELGLLKVGTVSVDGTHIKANASIDKSVRYDRAEQLEATLTADIADLMKQAEQADGQDGPDGQSLPKEIARRQKLLEKMRAARQNIEARAAQRAAAERDRCQKQCRRQSEDDDSDKPPSPPQPASRPRPQEQSNLTDDDSRIMRKSRRSEYRQAYNAQVAVDADGSQLILSNHVSNCASDGGELAPALENVPPQVGRPDRALADSGYVNIEAMRQIEQDGIDLYVAVGASEDHSRRKYEYRPVGSAKPKKITDPYLLAMADKLAGPGQQVYAKRKKTVEPVFGIIKSVMGFTQFLLRGLRAVSGEWSLVCLAYNFKRLYALRRAILA